MNSIQTRLMAIVAGGILALLIASMTAISFLNDVINDYRRVIEESVAQERSIHLINLDFKTQVQEWKNVLLRGQDAAAFDQYWNRFQQIHQEIQSLSAALLPQMAPGQAQQNLQAFKDSHENLAALYQQGRNAYVASGFDFRAGDAAVSGIDREPTALLQSAADTISRDNQTLALSLEAYSHRVSQISVIATIAASLLVMLVVWLTLKRGLVSPLIRVLTSIKGLASGNFRQQFDANRRDELGQLARDLTHMQSEIAGIIGAVQSTAGNLHHASSAIKRSSGDIVEHTSETETCTEQVAAAITEMSQTVLEVAGNASSVAASAEQVDHASRNGLQHMHRTIESINALSTDVNLVSDAIEKLEKDTTAIGAVLDVIRGIAEQTNLLALNAAIEAARAGEQGRGFAVVADEVRALARRTQESTAEIQQIIQNVQGGTLHAVNAMKQGSARSQSTVALAHESGQALQEITTSISHIKDMIIHIATAAEEQSYATEEINRNVVTVVNLVQSSHEAALQSANIANDVDQSSQRLQSLVNRFSV